MQPSSPPTSSARYRSTTLATSGDRTSPNPVEPIVPSHGVPRVGVEMAARTEHLGPAGADLLGATLADCDDRGRAVTEQCGADQDAIDGPRRRESQRAQLDRRATPPRRRARHAGNRSAAPRRRRRRRSPGRTSAPVARRDAVPSASRCGPPARHRKAGHGCRHDHVDVFRPQARLVERGRQRRAAELHCVLDPDVVRIAEVGRATAYCSSGNTR